MNKYIERENILQESAPSLANSEKQYGHFRRRSNNLQFQLEQKSRGSKPRANPRRELSKGEAGPMAKAQVARKEDPASNRAAGLASPGLARRTLNANQSRLATAYQNSTRPNSPGERLPKGAPTSLGVAVQMRGGAPSMPRSSPSKTDQLHLQRFANPLRHKTKSTTRQAHKQILGQQAYVRRQKAKARRECMMAEIIIQELAEEANGDQIRRRGTD